MLCRFGNLGSQLSEPVLWAVPRVGRRHADRPDTPCLTADAITSGAVRGDLVPRPTTSARPNAPTTPLTQVADGQPQHSSRLSPMVHHTATATRSLDRGKRPPAFRICIAHRSADREIADCARKLDGPVSPESRLNDIRQGKKR